MANVERRRAAFEAEIESVVYAARFAQRAEERRAVVNGFAQRIARLEEVAFAPGVFAGEDHAVVVGIALRRAEADYAISIEREDLFIRRDGAALSRVLDDDIRLIGVYEDPQLVACAPLIINLEREVIAELALNAEVVLIEVGAAYVRIDRVEAEHADLRSARPLLAEIRDQPAVLIEADLPREFVGLRDVGRLRGEQVVGRIEHLVGRNVVEDFVKTDPEARSNHGRIFAEDPLAPPRSVSEAQHRREVILVGIDAAARKRDRRRAVDQGVATLFGRINVEQPIRAEQNHPDAGDEVRPVIARLVNR